MTDITTRAAALLAAADKMTPGEWVEGEDDRNGQATVRGPHFEIASFWHHCVGSIEKEMRNNAAGTVVLHNDAPALIRELLAENERLRKEHHRIAIGNWDEYARVVGENERLRDRVTELESLVPGMFDEFAAKDAGPSPFQGRTTRRDEDDDKEYNFMMSHYEGRS